MLPWLGDPFNPSSLHANGRRARGAVDSARETFAKILGCLFGEVHFTSSGTEAANLAILGTAFANSDLSRNRVILGAAEHHCVLHTQEWLGRLGYSVSLAMPNQWGQVTEQELEKHMGDDVLLVSIMQANNELGSLTDIPRLVRVAKSFGALFHSDCVQSFPFCGSIDELGVDLLSASSHKVYGPTGSGLLYIRAGTSIKPTTVGGGQEREMRAGTENVAAIIGFATASQWCVENIDVQAKKKLARDAFSSLLVDAGFVPTLGGNTEVLPGHFHCRYPGIDAETMLILLDRRGISASSGAACSSGSLEPSHVLRACGYSEAESREGLRFTFGKDTTLAEAEIAAQITIESAHEILSKRN